MIGILIGRNEAESHGIVGGPLQLAAGKHARGVAVNQKSNQKPRMITGRARAAIGLAHRRHIQLIDDINHKRPVIVRQPVINRRRKQIRCLISRSIGRKLLMEAQPSLRSIARASLSLIQDVNGLFVQTNRFADAKETPKNNCFKSAV